MQRCARSRGRTAVVRSQRPTMPAIRPRPFSCASFAAPAPTALRASPSARPTGGSCARCCGSDVPRSRPTPSPRTSAGARTPRTRARTSHATGSGGSGSLGSHGSSTRVSSSGSRIWPKRSAGTRSGSPPWSRRRPAGACGTRARGCASSATAGRISRRRWRGAWRARRCSRPVPRVTSRARTSSACSPSCLGRGAERGSSFPVAGLCDAMHGASCSRPAAPCGVRGEPAC